MAEKHSSNKGHVAHPPPHHALKTMTPTDLLNLYEEDARNQLAYGMLIAVLGVIWLIKEHGWLDTNLPIGPYIIIITGLLVVYAKIKRDYATRMYRK